MKGWFRGSSPTSAAIHEDEKLGSYEQQVIDSLKAAHEQDATLQEVVVATRGLFPSEVVRYLRTLNITARQDGGIHCYTSPRYKPELHALDGEWYFTLETARQLASLARGRAVLCLGTPTVGVAAAASGSDVVLVDRNILVARRFHPLPSRLRFVVADATTRVLRPEFDVVFFDAPWYEPELLAWLATAVAQVRVGGVVAFPLYPELLRPSAADERDRVLNAAGRYGEVMADKGVVWYDIPLFEARALQTSGIVLDGPWRRADLIRLQVNHTGPRLALQQAVQRGRSRRRDWETFIVGQQVVKLRRQIVRKPQAHRSTEALGMVENLRAYDYGSVSRRDPTRTAIDLWTSRNRVAAVYERSAVAAALRLLAEESLHDAVSLAQSTSLRGHDANALLDLLELGGSHEHDRDPALYGFRDIDH